MFKEYIKLKGYIKIKWQYFILGIVFMILSTIFNAASLSSIVPLMDRVFSGKNIKLPANLPDFIGLKLANFINLLNSIPHLQMLKYLILFILVVIFLKGLTSYLNNYFFMVFGARLLTDLRNSLYKRITTFSMDFFSERQSGEITTRIIYDVNLLRNALVNSIPKFLFQIFLIITYLFIIFTIDWKLSLFSTLIFPLLLFPIFKIGKKLRKLGKRIQQAYGEIGNLINKSVYGQQIIKSYNQEKSVINQFNKENENIFKTIVSITKRFLLVAPFTEIVGAIGASGLIYYGARKVLEGSMDEGFLFFFFTAFFSLISPLKGIGTAYTTMKHASSALPRVFSILDKKNKVQDAGKKIFNGINEKIEFKNINFSYKNKEILKSITFSVKKGEKIGIVGPTGVGKTTLVGLILRFYDPVKGTVEIDGTDIRQFTLESLRNHIGFVPQESILFYDTAAKNIALSENINMEQVKKAVEIAGLKKFINSLPDKYETVVGERGIILSGGQKQLISIARAVYRNPEILILDEATASLDSNSEKSLQQALERIIEKRTVFIIAHRLSTLRNVNRIIVLKEGKIVEEGSHNELFEKKGYYYQLWQLQFSV